jgi:hypothetical protein
MMLLATELPWTGLVVPLTIGCFFTGVILWTRSDPIHDRSRYGPGGDLSVEPAVGAPSDAMSVRDEFTPN